MEQEFVTNHIGKLQQKVQEYASYWQYLEAKGDMPQYKDFDLSYKQAETVHIALLICGRVAIW